MTPASSGTRSSTYNTHTNKSYWVIAASTWWSSTCCTRVAQVVCFCRGVALRKSGAVTWVSFGPAGSMVGFSFAFGGWR